LLRDDLVKGNQGLAEVSKDSLVSDSRRRNVSRLVRLSRSQAGISASRCAIVRCASPSLPSSRQAMGRARVDSSNGVTALCSLVLPFSSLPFFSFRFESSSIRYFLPPSNFGNSKMRKQNEDKDLALRSNAQEWVKDLNIHSF